MYQFGFELEGFYRVLDISSNGGMKIVLPPKDYPTDGFPGLCEVRTVGAAGLSQAYYALMMAYAQTPFDKDTPEYIFSPADKRLIRARHNEKTAVNISNIYGKEPKALGNRTIASFQINISRRIRCGYTDDKGIKHPEEYGLFDYYPIIKALDDEFKTEIKAAGRQKGFYSVKDGCRVEYRSLPNSVFETDLKRVTMLLKRIQSCIV